MKIIKLIESKGSLVNIFQEYRDHGLDLTSGIRKMLLQTTVHDRVASGLKITNRDGIDFTDLPKNAITSKVGVLHHTYSSRLGDLKDVRVELSP